MEIFDPQCITFSQMNLIFNARIYYRRLTTWTRAYLIARYLGIGTAEAQFERLYLETLEIGDMLEIIFGRQVSEQYSQLLSRYAIIFHQLIEAQLMGDTQSVENNVELLYQNVLERAEFLERINPYWSAEGYQQLFNSYVQLIIETANAIMEGNYTEDIRLYDILREHTMRMGDVFAQGIYAYLTSGNTGRNSEQSVPCVTLEQMNDIYAIRMFWFELIIWTRNYMLRRYTNTGDADVALARLMEISSDYVTALKKYFPNLVVEDYMELLFTFIELIAEFISAMIENNTEKLGRITEDLYRNADDRAAFIASISPFWDEDQARNILYTNIKNTIEESTTLLSGDYEMNIDIFTRLLDQAEISSNFLAQGIFEHITQGQQAVLN